MTVTRRGPYAPLQLMHTSCGACCQSTQNTASRVPLMPGSPLAIVAYQGGLGEMATSHKKWAHQQSTIDMNNGIKSARKEERMQADEGKEKQIYLWTWGNETYAYSTLSSPPLIAPPATCGVGDNDPSIDAPLCRRKSIPFPSFASISIGKLPQES